MARATFPMIRAFVVIPATHCSLSPCLTSWPGDEDSKVLYGERSNGHAKRQYFTPVEIGTYKRFKQVDSGHDTFHQLQPAIKCESTDDDGVLSFLKARPQLASLERTNSKSAAPAKLEKPRTLNGEAANDLVNIDNFKDHPAAWQQSETIESFLHRIPVEDAATAQVGPWLWVGRPTVSHAHSLRKKPEETDTFITAGVELLQAFDLQRGKVEGDNSGKVAATITRKLAPHRDQLESDLLTLAVKMGTTNGKWMLFPSPSDLVRVWRIVASATAAGKLGPTSKIGTHDPTKSDTLICIYTYDFSDFEDVRRVLREVVDLGLCHADGKPLYYKCNAYTYLNISSGNSYKLRASLYSSKEILRNDVKALNSGPVARMKNRDGKKMTDISRAFAGDDIS